MEPRVNSLMKAERNRMVVIKAPREWEMPTNPIWSLYINIQVFTCSIRHAVRLGYFFMVGEFCPCTQCVLFKHTTTFLQISFAAHRIMSVIRLLRSVYSEFHLQSSRELTNIILCNMIENLWEHISGQHR